MCKATCNETVNCPLQKMLFGLAKRKHGSYVAALLSAKEVPIIINLTICRSDR